MIGRGEYAAALADLGFIDEAYARCIKRGNRQPESGDFDDFSDNARVVKAALCAGKLSDHSILMCLFKWRFCVQGCTTTHAASSCEGLH